MTSHEHSVVLNQVSAEVTERPNRLNSQQTIVTVSETATGGAHVYVLT
ncbi:MAG: hypothetical protein U0941_27350 [Planctomycetaceae bacterium]